MRKISVNVIVLAFATLMVVLCAASPAQAQMQKSSYPAMAPLNEYLMPESEEITLARSAAPKSVSDAADVMVLRRDGYAMAEKGTNGFLCIVERSWGAGTDDPDFWNPKVRSPICFNPSAARTFAPTYLMKTKLVLTGKSKTEIVQATTAAFDKKELPVLEPGAMCYMMSKQQYLNDRGKAWHAHLMFVVSGDVDKSWGANSVGSPVIAANDPEERVTIFMVWVGKWSDGTPSAP
jgi:hypothetical protein